MVKIHVAQLYVNWWNPLMWAVTVRGILRGLTQKTLDGVLGDNQQMTITWKGRLQRPSLIEWDLGIAEAIRFQHPRRNVWGHPTHLLPVAVSY